MPNKWVPAEVFVSHEGVTIYHTYIDDDMEAGRCDDRYGWDDHCYGDYQTFAIDDLPNPDGHDVDTEDGRKAVIREAIDIGILTQDGVANYRAEISVCGTCGKEFTEGEFDEKDLIGLAFSDDGLMSFVQYNNLRVANSGGVNLCRKCVNQIAENRTRTQDGVAQCDDTDHHVTVRFPAEAWVLLRQTLEKDAESSAFDRSLREEIRQALDQAEPMPSVGRLLDAVRDVLEWGEQTGGWEAPCWARLQQAVLDTSSEERRSGTAHQTLRRIFDILHLDAGPKGDFYNPEKNWDADTLDAIAEIVRPTFSNLLAISV